MLVVRCSKRFDLRDTPPQICLRRGSGTKPQPSTPRDALTHACVLVPVLARLLDSLSATSSCAWLKTCCLKHQTNVLHGNSGTQSECARDVRRALALRGCLSILKLFANDALHILRCSSALTAIHPQKKRRMLAVRRCGMCAEELQPVCILRDSIDTRLLSETPSMLVSRGKAS